MIIRVLVLFVLLSTSSNAATYYISPSGSNANDGLTTSTPWLTFAYAIDASRASCGDTLFLRDGTYGDGTSTGKISISSLNCTIGDELTIRAENQRQAKIVDDGTGNAVYILSSAYIIVDGLYLTSTDNSGSTSIYGRPLEIRSSNHITVRNSVGTNPNRYANTHVFPVLYSQDILLEDNECYVYHRHCTTGFQSERMIFRRIYGNPRGGRITGGYNAAAGTGKADAVVSMYPCTSCVAENIIMDGTTHGGYLVEMNATYGNSILMSNSKVLGSVCYKCTYANGILMSSRTAADTNHSPQNITISHVAFINYDSTSPAIRCSDCITSVIEHITAFDTGSSVNGIFFDDTANGGTAAQNSITVRDSVVSGFSTNGFYVEPSSHNTWTGNNLRSYNNSTSFSPTLPSNWGTTYTNDPAFGTCTMWVPSGSPGSGQGTSGSDIGATILYRYVDGVLTTTPLWDTSTGEFPHGAATADGINRVADASIDSLHTRLNVNTGGCSFPAGYGGGGGSTTVVKGTTAASGLSTTATPLTWNHTISASQDQLLVCLGLRDLAGNVGSASGIDVSGQAMTLVRREATVPSHRAAELWSLTNPTSGARTITVTLTGAISGALGRSIEFNNTSGLNTAVGVSANTGSTLSVTATTNTNEIVMDCTVSSSSSTYTHGVDQTGETDLSHASTSLLLAVSTQNGSLGGVMSNSTGSSVYQAKAAVSLIAGTPDPPSTATLTQSDYLFLYPRGTEAGAPPILSWLSDANAKNLPIFSRPNGYMRIRAMITGGVATTSPFGVALFCRKNAESYTKAVDTFGSTIFRLYGPGVTPDIPSSLTATSNRLCGSSCVTGAMLRDQSSSFTVPALTVGQKIELDSAVVFQATAGNTANCRYQKDDGTALDAYTNTPLITFTEDAAGAP